LALKTWDIATAELGRNGGFPNPLVVDYFRGVVLPVLVSWGWLVLRWRHPWSMLCNPSVSGPSWYWSQPWKQSTRQCRGFMAFYFGLFDIIFCINSMQRCL